MNFDEYQQFENDCRIELETKLEKIAELLLFDERDIDLLRERIRFLEGEEVSVEAEIVTIGSWGLESGTWMWGWANPSVDSALRASSSALKELSITTGRQEFSSDKPFAATEREVWGMVAVACHHLDGIGVYRLIANDSDWFCLIRTLTHFKPPELLAQRASQVAADSLLRGLGARNLNLLRKRFPEMRLHLMGADLRGEQEPWAYDLHVQPAIDWGYFSTHKPHDMTGADLSRSRLDGAIMRGATLCEATFESTSLVDADLTGADARGASFRNAFLNGVNFTRAKLAGADFTEAELARTLLTDVDISEVKGLDDVHHSAPSEISMSTLIASQFKITLTFLRKAGVSRGLLQDLVTGKRFSKMYQTCFLSYSSKDQEFAAQLYRSLADAGVRVFWDRFEVIPGEYLDNQIMEAIREHDRLLVVLSAQSMASKWVRREIELAYYHKRESLVLVRLCPIEDIRRWTKQYEELPDLAELFPVLDFSGWRTREEYVRLLSLLLKSLSGGVDFYPNANAP